MDLKDLMVISGYPGLYRFISQGRNAIIVESLEDKKRMSAYSTSRISTLEEIAMFTETGELPLADVLERIYKHSGGTPVLSHKSPEREIKGFFQEVLPEYDRDRVYVSDMKKIINWYNLLLNYGLLKPDPEKPDNSGSDPGETGSGQTDRESAGSDQGAGETAVNDPKGGQSASGDETGGTETGKTGTGGPGKEKDKSEPSGADEPES